MPDYPGKQGNLFERRLEKKMKRETKDLVMDTHPVEGSGRRMSFFHTIGNTVGGVSGEF